MPKYPIVTWFFFSKKNKEKYKKLSQITLTAIKVENFIFFTFMAGPSSHFRVANTFVKPPNLIFFK